MTWFKYNGKTFVPPSEEGSQILLIENGIINGWLYELSVQPSLDVEAFVRKDNNPPIKVFGKSPQSSEFIPNLLRRGKQSIIDFIKIQ